MRRRIYEIIEVAKPGDRGSAVYDVLLFLCIAASLGALFFKEHTPAFDWTTEITVGFFALDYLLRWFTADYKYPGKSKRRAFLLYPLTPLALCDLLSILPSLTLLMDPHFKLFKLFKFCKLQRLPRLLHHLRQLMGAPPRADEPGEQTSCPNSNQNAQLEE